VWLIEDEERQLNEREERQMRYTVAATNPKLYLELFPEKAEDEIDLSEVNWETPTTPEEAAEIEDILQQLSAQRVGHDPAALHSQVAPQPTTEE